MVLELASIRKVFPDWPSELDAAKCETNWAFKAQEFYCAASVLYKEMTAVHRRMHSSDSLVMTEDIAMRIHVTYPALFCMAFALELAAKAATIRKCQGKGIEHAKRLPFAGHCLVDLCAQLTELKMSADEQKLIEQAEQIIVKGKYPSDIKPRDDKPFPGTPQLSYFMESAVPIYLQLMSLSCDAQSTASVQNEVGSAFESGMT